jgi:hypothetical protein
MFLDATLVRAFLRRAPDLAGPGPAAPAGVPSRVVLPFATDIPIRSYLDHALPLSIVVTEPGHRDALLSSFIQIFFPDDKLDYDRVLMLPSLGFSEWTSLGLLERLPIDVNARALAQPERLFHRLVEQLNQGWYLEAQIDEFFLTGRACHQRVHSVHDNLLFGYDLERRTLLVAGYAQDYGTAELPLSDVLAAFYLMPKSQLARRRLVAYRPCTAAPALDVEAIAAQLRDYLDSRASLSPAQLRRSPPYWKARRTTGRWGLATYAAFDEYVTRQASTGSELDLRATRTLWEHKLGMLARLRRLESLGCLRSEGSLAARYAAVETLAKAARFEAFEYNACGRARARADALRASLERMHAIEAELLRQALLDLKGIPCS